MSYSPKGLEIFMDRVYRERELSAVTVARKENMQIYGNVDV